MWQPAVEEGALRQAGTYAYPTADIAYAYPTADNAYPAADVTDEADAGRVLMG